MHRAALLVLLCWDAPRVEPGRADTTHETENPFDTERDDGEP